MTSSSVLFMKRRRRRRKCLLLVVVCFYRFMNIHLIISIMIKLHRRKRTQLPSNYVSFVVAMIKIWSYPCSIFYFNAFFTVGNYCGSYSSASTKGDIINWIVTKHFILMSWRWLDFKIVWIGFLTLCLLLMKENSR